jgi:hypothetical protein
MRPINSHPVCQAQFGKLLRLLASDKDGEVIAIVAAIKRTLASRSLDFHDLAVAVDVGLQKQPPAKSKTPRARSDFAERPGGRFHMGEHIICDRIVGLFRRCRCGCEAFTVMPGIGPHPAQLCCDSCGLGGRWLARHYFG